MQNTRFKPLQEPRMVPLNRILSRISLISLSEQAVKFPDPGSMNDAMSLSTHQERGDHVRVVGKAGNGASLCRGQGVPDRNVAPQLAETSHCKHTGATADVRNIHATLAQPLQHADSSSPTLPPQPFKAPKSAERRAQPLFETGLDVRTGRCVRIDAETLNQALQGSSIWLLWYRRGVPGGTSPPCPASLCLKQPAWVHQHAKWRQRRPLLHPQTAPRIR